LDVSVEIGINAFGIGILTYWWWPVSFDISNTLMLGLSKLANMEM